MSLSASLMYSLETDLNRRRFEMRFGFEEAQRQHRVLSMLRSIPGVADAELWYEARGAILKQGPRLKEAGSGTAMIGIPAQDSTFYKPLMIAGRWFQPGDGRVIVISKETADDNHLKLGDAVTLNLSGLSVRLPGGLDLAGGYSGHFHAGLYTAGAHRYSDQRPREFGLWIKVP